MFIGRICLMLLITGRAASVITNTSMLDILDDMQKLMTGQEKFNRHYYTKLLNCIGGFGPETIPTHNTAWWGLIKFWRSGGTLIDGYGQKLNFYSEYNVTALRKNKVLIHEPCNFASSVVYYRPITEICDRMAGGRSFSISEEYLLAVIKSFVHLVFSSCFMHATNTELGLKLDHISISAIGYVLHQSIMEPFRDSVVLYQLSTTNRSHTAIGFVNEIEKMHRQDVTRWKDTLDGIDLPEKTLPIAAVICTMYSILYEKYIVDLIVAPILRVLGVGVEDIMFLVNVYLPALRQELGNLKLGLLEFKTFLFNSIGTIMKLLYGLAWREFIPDPILDSTLPNYIGELFLPKVNYLASIFTDYPYYDQNFQKGKNLYPGDVWCNRKYPHSKWHVETAIGLLDYVYLADTMYNILAARF